MFKNSLLFTAYSDMNLWTWKNIEQPHNAILC